MDYRAHSQKTGPTRILVAEDDLTSRAMISAVLRKVGHHVVEARDGEEAWSTFQEANCPKIAILDWMMPGMDGLELIRRVRAVHSDKPPYLIMLTARSRKEDIVLGLDAGADDYLSKPFDPGELMARIAVGSRFIALQEDLVESRKALMYQALHDPLTDLPNRRATLERMEQEVGRIHRYGGVLMVGMCDIDHFKLVNDTHGHHMGDEVLKGVATVLRAGTRASDVVGRLGGEEFLVAMHGEADLPQMGFPNTEPFERLVHAIRAIRFKGKDGPFGITISIGVAIADQTTSMTAVLAEADACMYAAKQSGRDRVACSHPATSAA